MTRILIVEDDRWVAQVNRGLVEAGGHTVIGVASTVQEGLELAARLQPDLILLDMYLPGGSGLDLLLALRAAGQVTDVIMLTAADDLQSVRQALALGALDYVIKPFEQARLLEAVSRVTGRRGFPSSAFTQHRLDQFLGLPGVALPKGIEAGMLKRTRQVLEGAGAGTEGAPPQALSAEDVGAQLGVSRVTAWRYLEYLLETGQVELDFSYGLPGRPAKLYRSRSAGPPK
ncbi:response regulator [Deinococcus altitudinis]|uniref:response regulator n=1 Tax=Deinococcus altitudinis TaxID=468914 RepID=UPI0038926650